MNHFSRNNIVRNSHDFAVRLPKGLPTCPLPSQIPPVACSQSMRRIFKPFSVPLSHGAGVARNRIFFAASMTSPLCLVRADGAARLRRSAAPSADICRFAEIESVKPNSQGLRNRACVVSGVREWGSRSASRILSMLSCLLPIAVFAIHAFAVAAPIAADDGLNTEQTEFFESKIRPVLVAHCYECHSGEAATPKGGLRLDLRETTLAGGDSGPAVIAGQPAESPLLQALRYESFEMPPKGKLPDTVIADFERWIQMGAPDPRTEMATRKSTRIDYQKGLEFWAFKPPVRVPLPGVVNSAWARNDIDHFVLSELEKRGLKPAQEADRRTLIRRLYFDLVGLPPEPEAIDLFVNDTSSDAYEKVIDGLLASPHYGERWGRYWLDLARFAEDQAHTFQARMYPQGYLYRDWVVRALNDDMPYDQFLRLQIAGDQIDVPESHRHRAALGLFALGPVYYQDNGEQEKAQADEWDDRIDTLMRGTQALTVSCARCHDHKYDPISTADYYGLAGIFASSDYREMPAVPAETVTARELADRAVQEKQLEIDTLLATEAPAARLKLTSSIPAYMQAAWTAFQSGDSDKKKVTEKIATDNKLNHDLLQRWVAWLSDDAGSGTQRNERSYLTEWREFRKSHREASSTAYDASSQVAQIAGRLRARAESLLPQRESLRRQFGDNFAFVSAEDRTIVEPGIVPLGNLFDDKKGSLLTSALASDPFRSTATSASLGVDRVLHGWGGSAEIAAGVRFDFQSIGSDSHRHGDVTNDGWSSEGGIQTLGKKCSASIGRTEQGIGMHANALITFDLEEIRRSGLMPASQSMVFRVDRAGINDDSFGVGSSVHIAVVVSRPQSKPSEFDSIIGAYLDGKPVEIEENDAVYSFAGEMPPAIVPDGRFVSFNVSIPPDARSLTIASTGAEISDTENTISSDHAVLSNARLTWDASAEQLASSETIEPLDTISDAERQLRQSDAALLSELFDDRGVLGLAPDQIEPLLEGEAAASLAQIKMRREELRKDAAAISIPMAHALTEGTVRDVKIFLAGDPTKKGDVAPRAFPAIFTSGERQPFQTSGSGRSELANAIASPGNPLTARVMANRVWAGHFGFGLVRTLSNFGQLGERPSHPELLDSLAISLIESGWSLKALHRQILLSATWRQSSSGDNANQTVDPENSLLWKMNRRRLEIEPWRDAVLSVSGQLNREIGGASSELNGNHRRRTLYGSVSRHRLNDLLRLFDFPDPNITAGERSITTVPLQQLFVLNSDFMIVQAKALAARLSREAESDADRISRLFQLIYGRMPTDEDINVSVAFLQEPSAEVGDSLSPLEQYCLAMLGTNEFAYVD